MEWDEQEPTLRERWLRVFDLGIPADAESPDLMRRIRITSIATLAMFLIGFPSIFQYASLGIHRMTAAVSVTMLLALGNLVLLRATRRPGLCGHLAVAILGTLLVISNVTSGGFYDPNFAWLYLLPICAAVMVELRGATIWTAITVGIAVSFWSLPGLGIELVSQIPPEVHPGQSLFNRVTAIVAIGLLAASFVTGQRRGERELARANDDLSRQTSYVHLLKHAADSANEGTSFQEAMRRGAARICSTMGWPVAHICDVNEDGTITSSGAFLVSEPERFAELRELTARATYRSGEGLPGRAVATGEVQCVDDLKAPGLRKRAGAALDRGLCSAFAIPVPVNGEIRAVLEFAAFERLASDERLLEVLAHVGVRLGRVAEQSVLQDRVRQSQKMEAVGQLAAGLAHEINNPMAYVRSNLHALREEWDALRSKLEASSADAQTSQLLDECQELVVDSLEGVERTISIVRDVNEFSHSGTGHMDAREIAELPELIDGALRVAAPRSPYDVHIERAYGPVPPVSCSPNQLRQVFVNLVVNALQAVGQEGTVRISTVCEGEYAVARVEDDGPGIPPELRERLFDPFFTTKGVGEGTGLGLYVSYEIVRAHGGEIGVRSEPGATCFEVRLPLERPSAA